MEGEGWGGGQSHALEKPLASRQHAHQPMPRVLVLMVDLAVLRHRRDLARQRRHWQQTAPRPNRVRSGRLRISVGSARPSQPPAQMSGSGDGGVDGGRWMRLGAATVWMVTECTETLHRPLSTEGLRIYERTRVLAAA